MFETGLLACLDDCSQYLAHLAIESFGVFDKPTAWINRDSFILRVHEIVRPNHQANENVPSAASG